MSNWGCLVPVVLLGGIIWYCIYCDSHAPRVRLEPDRLISVDLGTVKGIDGQPCRVEEVQRVRQYSNMGRVRTLNTPIAHRTICPNGPNGISVIGDDGTKFHRETIDGAVP